MDYNVAYEDETEKREEILRQIIGELGEGSFLQGPIYFHYGKHTKIGKNLFPRAMSQAQECFSPAFGECREGQIPRSLLRNKLDAP